MKVESEKPMPAPLPDVIEIEPTSTCNLRCRMCHVSFMPEEPRPVLDPLLLETLAPLRGKYFILGSGFEPMMNPQFPKLLRTLSALDAQVELITNGTLLDDDILSALADTDIRLVTFSFDGISKKTFEHIRRRADHGKTLDKILRARARLCDRETFFAVNSTMMRCNMAETAPIVDFWEKADFDLVRFVTMVVREPDAALIRESLYPVRQEYYRLLDQEARKVIETPRRISVAGKYFPWSPLAREYPHHLRGNQVISNHPRARYVPPRRQDAQLGSAARTIISCKSPWTFARILPEGDVQLCYQFTIGNLKEQSFEDIWNGPRAAEVRQRVVHERTLCSACDYYRFCLSPRLDPEDRSNFFAGSLLMGLDEVDFETGRFGELECAEPRLVETVGTYNLVAFDKRYIGVPQCLGPIDLSHVKVDGVPGLIFAATLQELRGRIRSQALPFSRDAQRSAGPRSAARRG